MALGLSTLAVVILREDKPITVQPLQSDTPCTNGDCQLALKPMGTNGLVVMPGTAEAQGSVL